MQKKADVVFNTLIGLNHFIAGVCNSANSKSLDPSNVLIWSNQTDRRVYTEQNII